MHNVNKYNLCIYLHLFLHLHHFKVQMHRAFFVLLQLDNNCQTNAFPVEIKKVLAVKSASEIISVTSLRSAS